MSSERAIRVIRFSGSKKDWRKWSRKFLAMSVKRGYKDVLLGKTREEGMTDDEKNLNGHAYNDIMLSMDEDVSFSIVDEACTEELPEGDSAMAWRKLEAKYNSQTNSSKVKLMKQLNRSKLKNKDHDPDHWVSELEVIRSQLKKMNVSIEDDYFMIHILNNLPGDYENLVDALEVKIDAKSEPLTLEALREKLSAKYEKLIDREENESENEENDETALAGFGSFKGRCYVCGKFGHKGSDCPEREKTPRPKKFTGTCNYCGMKGHKEINCWKKKRDLEREKAEKDASNVAGEEDESDESDSEGLSLMCREAPKYYHSDDDVKYDYEKVNDTNLMCLEDASSEDDDMEDDQVQVDEPVGDIREETLQEEIDEVKEDMAEH